MALAQQEAPVENKVLLYYDGEVISSDNFVVYIHDGSLGGAIYTNCGLGSLVTAKVLLDEALHEDLIEAEDEWITDNAVKLINDLTELRAGGDRS